MAEDDPADDAGAPAPRRTRNRTPPTGTAPAGPPPKKRTKTEIAIEEAAARLAAEAPPLSEAQRRRLTELLASAVSAARR